MPCRLDALTFDALDPARLAAFWAGLLGGDPVPDPQGGTTFRPTADPGFRLRFRRTEVPKTGPNQMHFDLTSTSWADQQATVDRALALGGRYVDVGRLPEEKHVNLGDPEGNEFDVIQPGNRFLADTGFVGALASDGSRACGLFWSRVLDWPLVWDQDEETAIQSPAGGPKITWGGPPLPPKTGKYRLHFDLAPVGGQQAEVARLLGLGASPIDIGQREDDRVDWVVLADPDGHEFCVLADQRRPAPTNAD